MNKVAVITGGARRLGRQISYYFAQNGYDLAIIYNSSSSSELKQTTDKLNALKVNFEFYKCDLEKVSTIKKTVEKIGRTFDRIDVLVNNSGIINRIKPEDITERIFNKTININLSAPLFVSQSAVRYLKKAKSPVIINIASLGGFQNWSGFIPYSVSKTALIKLTYLLARSLAPKVRVNAIAPGTIIIEGEEAGTPDKIEVSKIPLKKYGKTADIISAIDFILKCEYLTGHVIPVDGGRLLNN